MKKLLEILIINDLTPNQLYLLYTIQEKEVCQLINTALELRLLNNKKVWLNSDNTLTNKSIKLLKEIENNFQSKNKKENAKIKPALENIKKYNELWPKMTLPTGKAARSAIGNLVPAFEWFFNNYNFTWESIYKATSLYLDEKESQNWHYTRNSQYFIRKQGTDKVWSSDLADYCQLIEDKGDKFNENQFKETIF